MSTVWFIDQRNDYPKKRLDRLLQSPENSALEGRIRIRWKRRSVPSILHLFRRLSAMATQDPTRPRCCGPGYESVCSSSSQSSSIIPTTLLQVVSRLHHRLNPVLQSKVLYPSSRSTHGTSGWMSRANGSKVGAEHAQAPGSGR